MTQGQISPDLMVNSFPLKTQMAQVWMTTNINKCQLSEPYIEANMQMSGGKAEKALTLPKPQGHLHPSFLYLSQDKAYGLVSRENVFFTLSDSTRESGLWMIQRAHPKCIFLIFCGKFDLVS